MLPPLLVDSVDLLPARRLPRHRLGHHRRRRRRCRRRRRRHSPPLYYTAKTTLLDYIRLQLRRSDGRSGRYVVHTAHVRMSIRPPPIYTPLPIYTIKSVQVRGWLSLCAVRSLARARLVVRPAGGTNEQEDMMMIYMRMRNADSIVRWSNYSGVCDPLLRTTTTTLHILLHTASRYTAAEF